MKTYVFALMSAFLFSENSMATQNNICLKLFEGNTSNVVSFNLNDRLPRILTAHENIVESTETDMKSKDLRGLDADEVETLSSRILELLKVLEDDIRNANPETISQNRVWSIYSQYTQSKTVVEKLLNFKNVATPAELVAVYAALEKIETSLTETRFFFKMKQRGYTLTPPEGTKIKKELNADLAEKISRLNLELSYIQILISGGMSWERMFDSELQRTLNSSFKRRRLLEDLYSRLSEVKQQLDQLRTTPDLASYDLDTLDQEIKRIRSLIGSNYVQSTILKLQKSMFNSRREAAHKLQLLVERVSDSLVFFEVRNAKKIGIASDVVPEVKARILINDETMIEFVQESNELRFAQSFRYSLFDLNSYLDKFISLLGTESSTIAVSKSRREMTLSYLNLLESEARDSFLRALPFQGKKYLRDEANRYIENIHILKKAFEMAGEAANDSAPERTEP